MRGNRLKIFLRGMGRSDVIKAEVELVYTESSSKDESLK